MLLVTTALMIEANPLKDALGLKADVTAPCRVFTRGETVLVVTGTGAQNAAAATGWAMGRYPGITAAINLGFAGAASAAASLYEWYRIHSIRDQSSGRLHIPDILDRHAFAEAALLTSGKPVKSGSSWSGLVDMEGSGFYAASRTHLPPDKIALLKWVSDPLCETIDQDKIIRRYKSSLDKVLTFLDDWGDPTQKDVAPPELLNEVLERLRLTDTQQAFLAKWLKGYLARAGNPETVRSMLPAKPPGTKTVNTSFFNQLKDVLKG